MLYSFLVKCRLPLSIFKLLEGANPSPKSRFENAVRYILDRRQSFLNILKDGHLELSNNSAERGIKSFVIARKNFLFSNTENGAESSAMIFSIIQTAIANGLKARDYLERLITEIPEDPTEEELEKLLPWNINPNPIPSELVRTGQNLRLLRTDSTTKTAPKMKKTPSRSLFIASPHSSQPVKPVALIKDLAISRNTI